VLESDKRWSSEEVVTVPAPLLAIIIAVPLIAIFVLFVLVPRLRHHEEEQKRGLEETET
jgi:hypothetical protein